MPAMVRSVCVLGALAAPVLSVRVSVEDAQLQEIDWKHLATLGTIGAAGLAWHAVEADEPAVRRLSKAQKTQMIEELLIDNLHGEKDAENAAVTKLVHDLYKKNSPHVFNSFLTNLEEHGMERFYFPAESSSWFGSWWKCYDCEEGAEYYGIGQQDGRRAVVLKRFPSSLRTKEEIDSLQNTLKGYERAKGHPFLEVVAKSHEPNAVSKDPSVEVMVMTEPFTSTLREYIHSNRVSLPKKLSMFHSVMIGVETLYRKSVPHNSVITPDNVLVTGNAASPLEIEAVLCPSIFHTDLQVCSVQEQFWRTITFRKVPEDAIRPRELLKEDIKHLGDLLEWILSTAKAVDREEMVPWEALADAMKSGSFTQLTGKKGAIKQFQHVAVATTTVATYKQSLSAARGQGSQKGLGDLDEWDMLYDYAMDNLRATVQFLRPARKAAIAGSKEAEVEFQREQRQAARAAKEAAKAAAKEAGKAAADK